jgi:hypothetical protein
VSALGGTTYATGLTGTSTVIPNSRFTSYGSYPIQVVAIAGTTYSVSAGATLRFTPAPPDDIMVNYLSTQGCQLSWAPDPFSNKLSYSITELTGATFSIVQGPTFNSASGLWLAGVSFGSAQVYDFFISGGTTGTTGPTSEIVVYVPPATQPSSILYRTPGTYTVTIPRGFSGFQAQLVGGGGGGGAYESGGGGAGAFAVGLTLALVGTTFQLLVGDGGSGARFVNDRDQNHYGNAGETSSIAGIVATGGGGGKSGYIYEVIPGIDGVIFGTGGPGGTYNVSVGQVGGGGGEGRGGGGGSVFNPLGGTYGYGGQGRQGRNDGLKGNNGCAVITFVP